MSSRRRWPAPQRILLTTFPAIRARGMPLFPAAEPCCAELEPLPKALESLPAILQNAVEKGFQRGVREAPPIVTQGSPLESPPFRHTSLNDQFALIIGTSTTIEGISSINQGLIGNCAQTSGAQLPILQKTAGFVPNDQNTFRTYRAADYERIHIQGVDFAVSSLDALLTLAFSVYVDGAAVLDRVRLGALRRLSIEVPPGGMCRWKVSIPDSVSVFLLYMTIYGWRYTVEGQGNYFSQTVLKEDGQFFIPNAPCVPSRRALNNGENGGTCP